MIGIPVPRKEGVDKVTGRAQYVDDLTFPGMLTGVTVRSPVAHGRILGIRFGEGIPWDEFTIVTAEDIPGTNAVHLIEDDQPYLASDLVNHADEPILLLAHADRYLAEEARRRIHLNIDPLPAVFSMEESSHCFKSYRVEKGDIEAGFEDAEIIVEGEYETGAQEQLYIEPQGMIATANPEDGVTVWGSMQCPYYVHKALVPLFGLPEDKVRVIQMETGGGFGGKEEYPSMIAGHAALLAWKSGRPVKIVYDRSEDLAATTKRHPSRTRHRTGVRRDGKLTAMHIDFVLDGGAYCTLSPVVLSRGTIHAGGPYACPNVRIDARAMATNHPPYGAFRGFGAPQSIFALERHMNKAAAAIGLEPEEFRRRNLLQAGECTATGQVIHEQIDLPGLMDRALELSGYREKSERFARENPGRAVKKGIGFATFMHGAGFTGSGEVTLASVAGVEATSEGRVRVLAASTEIGQGTKTVFAQIASQALGVHYDDIDIAQPDTAGVPNSGPTVASRTSMVVGKLVESAARGLRQTLISCGLLGEDYTRDEFHAACRRYLDTQGPLRSFSGYQPPPGVVWDDQHYRGDAYGTFAWACYVADVSVDMTSYEARVDDFVAVQEIGRVLHPVLAAGQIEGGVAQAVGYALYEKVAWREGRMANSQMTNYIIPTSADVPRIRVYFEEQPYLYGPGGAKGIGELPMDGPAPAILNAIEHATGIAFDRIPLFAEDLMNGLANLEEACRAEN